jgi:UDP-glucose 4-epimerase
VRVLVTGASGRIGSHLTRALIVGGHDVSALVLPGDRRAPELAAEGVSIVQGGLGDREILSEAVRDIEAVFHLAGALTSRGNTDEEFFEVNLRGTFNLLMAVREHAPDIRCFAYASSDGVYAGPTRTPAFLPIDESHPRTPGSVYSASKVGAEELCLTFWRFFGVPTTILRFSATADPSELLDTDSVFGPLFFLKATIRALTPGGGRGVIRLVPADPRGPSPAQLEALRVLEALDDGPDKLLVQQYLDGRPMVYEIAAARDVGEGIAAVLERPAAIGETFNIGGPGPFAADEAVKRLAAGTGLEVVAARLPTTRPPWYTSSAKARAVLGYNPRYGLLDMIDEALTDRLGPSTEGRS